MQLSNATENVTAVCTIDTALMQSFHQSLRASVSSLSTSTCLVNDFRLPQNRRLLGLTDRQNFFYTGDYVCEPYPNTKFGAYWFTGACGQIGEI